MWQARPQLLLLASAPTSHWQRDLDVQDSLPSTSQQPSSHLEPLHMQLPDCQQPSTLGKVLHFGTHFFCTTSQRSSGHSESAYDQQAGLEASPFSLQLHL